MVTHFPTRARRFFFFGAGLLGCAVTVIGCSPAPPPTAGPPVTTPGRERALPVADPVAFLQKCLERYDRQNIRGYRVTMHKQERIGGVLHEPEVIEAAVRAHPFSVFLHWLSGARGASSLLYVEGENNGNMLVHPTGLAGSFVHVVEIDPDGPRAREDGRYGIKTFGLRNTLERTLHDWQAAKEKGTLRVEYLGIRKVEELGNRPCYTLQRTLPEPEDGLGKATIYIDEQTWFQVGSVEEEPGGELLGKYLYSDIQLNPEFPPDQFSRSALR